ncbi:MAG: serine/threonine protein kinase [Planctomycetes bacterium]|nr:serine/threonine protein kinase [Planctomycetota bacterium]NBY03345.1 serine/threonine protein kinase [Planctomycetota bacterium]
MNQDKEVYPGYLIESLLAQGPVTVVYSAIDLASGLPCVIKTVRLDYLYEKQALAFLKNEIKVLETIKHAACPVLLKSNIEIQPFFFVMEKVEGCTLRHELERKFSFSPPVVIEISRQILSFLSNLHGIGFTHGDIKPENILIGQSKKIKIVDFAFSSNVRMNEKLETNLMLGTPNYIAPELCAEIPVISLENDIYSLGVLIFEMLTGSLPHPEGTISQTLLRHQSDPPAKLRQKLGELNPKFINAIVDMLSFDLHDRPKAKNLLDIFVKFEIENMVSG